MTFAADPCAVLYATALLQTLPLVVVLGLGTYQLYVCQLACGPA